MLGYQMLRGQMTFLKGVLVDSPLFSNSVAIHPINLYSLNTVTKKNPLYICNGGIITLNSKDC